MEVFKADLESMNLNFDYLGTREGMLIEQLAKTQAEINGKVEIGETYVKVIIFKMLQQLRSTLGVNASKSVSEKVSAMVEMILFSFGRKITLSGLAHSFYLIGTAADGYDSDLMGFEPRGINRLIRKYLQVQGEKRRKKDLEIIADDSVGADVSDTVKVTPEVKAFRRKQVKTILDMLVSKIDGKRKKEQEAYESQYEDREYENVYKFCHAHKLEVDEVKKFLVSKWVKMYDAAVQLSGSNLDFEIYVQTKRLSWLDKINESDAAALECADYLRKNLINNERAKAKV